MAALASTLFFSPPKHSHSSSSNPISKCWPAKSLSPENRRNLICPIVVSALRKNLTLTSEVLDEDSSHNSFKKLVDSVFVLCAGFALSVSLFAGDVDSASAFVVTPPRKLQPDELATVRLFQENTPSVVYVTNLASRYGFVT